MWEGGLLRATAVVPALAFLAVVAFLAIRGVEGSEVKTQAAVCQLVLWLRLPLNHQPSHHKAARLTYGGGPSSLHAFVVDSFC